jgi:hypothetical protein
VFDRVVVVVLEWVVDIGPVILGVHVLCLSSATTCTCRGAWPDLRAAARNGEACDESTHAELIIGTAKRKDL